jgi:hypothetical protein
MRQFLQNTVQHRNNENLIRKHEDYSYSIGYNLEKPKTFLTHNGPCKIYYTLDDYSYGWAPKLVTTFTKHWETWGRWIS